MSDLPVLDPVEQRVLGSLLEKERTVPATYPLTLNALRTACNQTSSRDPVTDYDDATLETTLKALRQRGLVRVVWADTGRRTLKYHQVLAEQLALQPDERALLTVLLLRGPQAPGELRTRTDRLHPFVDRDQVERCLQRMADGSSGSPPLVRELPRQAGERDRRWTHLLGPPAPDPGPAPAPDTADRDRVLADGSAARDAKVAAAYGAVASAYADRFAAELDDLPFETWLLGRVAGLAGPYPVADVGCGPGHVTHHLSGLGVDATGVDVVPEMVAEARRRFPEGRYEVGDLRRLMAPPTSSGWGAVLAWYSLIHLAASELPGAMAALTRPLRPGGCLVVAVHAGSEVRHLDTWLGAAVDLDAVLHDPAEVRAAAEQAGLVDAEWYHRGPLRAREETTERFYLLARKPG